MEGEMGSRPSITGLGAITLPSGVGGGAASPRTLPPARGTVGFLIGRSARSFAGLVSSARFLSAGSSPRLELGRAGGGRVGTGVGGRWRVPAGRGCSR
jgi:hypothetical protein